MSRRHLPVILSALIWPLDLALRPDEQTSRSRPGPSLEHPFGTDKFGRDLFTRAAIGTRVSIFIGFGATLAILLIGVVVRVDLGLRRRLVDNTMMRLLDALYGLPYLPFAIITLAIIGTVNAWTMVIALSIASWFTAAGSSAADHHAETERLCSRGACHRCALVPDPQPAPVTEHLGVLIIAIFLELPA